MVNWAAARAAGFVLSGAVFPPIIPAFRSCFFASINQNRQEKQLSLFSTKSEERNLPKLGAVWLAPARNVPGGRKHGRYRAPLHGCFYQHEERARSPPRGPNAGRQRTQPSGSPPGPGADRRLRGCSGPAAGTATSQFTVRVCGRCPGHLVSKAGERRRNDSGSEGPDSVSRATPASSPVPTWR